MDLLGIAQSGLQQAQGHLEKAARRIASPADLTDSVDLSDEMISLASAQNQYEANLTVAHTAKEMEKATIDLLA